MTDCPACRGAGFHNAPFGCGGRCCFQRCAACAGTGTLRLARVSLTKRSAAARTAALDRWRQKTKRTTKENP